MSQAGPSTSSARPMKSTKQQMLTHENALKHLEDAPDYAYDLDLLTELLAALRAEGSAKTAQQKDDLAMETRLGRAISSCHLHEILGRLAPEETKAYLTHTFSVGESTPVVNAFIKFSQIPGLDSSSWYRGLGKFLDKQDDPILALWRLLLPLLGAYIDCAHRQYKSTTTRQPIEESPPPRRDYNSLFNIDPTEHGQDEVVEINIPTTLESTPTTHPGSLRPRRLWEYGSSDEHNWEFDYVQVRLCEYLRAHPGDFNPLSPTTPSKIVMPLKLFEVLAWESDAEIRLLNLRWMVERYRGRISYACFHCMENEIHSNLSFGSGLDCRGFFRINRQRGCTRIREHWSGTCFEALWKLALEACTEDADLLLHFEWSVAYFRLQCQVVEAAFLEFHKFRPRIPPMSAPPPSSPAPAFESVTSNKRKNDGTTESIDDEGVDSSIPSKRRANPTKTITDTLVGNTSSVNGKAFQEKGQKGKGRWRARGGRGGRKGKKYRTPLQDLNNINQASTRSPSQSMPFPTSSFNPDIPAAARLSPASDRSMPSSSSSHLSVPAAPRESSAHRDNAVSPSVAQPSPPETQMQPSPASLIIDQSLLHPALSFANNQLYYSRSAPPITLSDAESAMLYELMNRILGRHFSSIAQD